MLRDTNRIKKIEELLYIYRKINIFKIILNYIINIYKFSFDSIESIITKDNIQNEHKISIDDLYNYLLFKYMIYNKDIKTILLFCHPDKQPNKQQIFKKCLETLTNTNNIDNIDIKKLDDLFNRYINNSTNYKNYKK